MGFVFSCTAVQVLAHRSGMKLLQDEVWMRVLRGDRESRAVPSFKCWYLSVVGSPACGGRVRKGERALAAGDKLYDVSVGTGPSAGEMELCVVYI